ncbi:MAG: ABC transporter permease [Candidatus Nanopelagicaceae bacterium]|nr:ABC transporter permease [Candidatus Nanopelagicaceae bacterium]
MTIVNPKPRKRVREGSFGLYMGFSMIFALILGGAIVPRLSKYDPNVPGGTPIAAPSGAHWFGTDLLGRDVFTRVFDAVFIDLGTAIIGVSIPLVVGTIVGTLLGISRNKRVNSVVGSIIDGINAFPFLIFVIALIAFIGPGIPSIVLALSLVNWARYARVARTRAVVVNQQGYVEAARILGFSKIRILFKHIIPNVSSETRAYALSDFIIVIIAVAALSFLGMGTPPPQAEWGAMIKDGTQILALAWWPTIFPGLALCWAGVAVAFVAEGMQRRLRETNTK